MTEGLTCKEVSRLISLGLDQDMPPSERARLRYHFVLCRACRNVDEQLRFLSVAMKQIDKDLPPDP